MGGERPVLVVAESGGFPEEAAATLREHYRLVLADLDRPALLQAVEGADVLWVRLRHEIDREVLERGARLRLIVSPTTGLNHIDVAAAAARGIRVVSLQGEVGLLCDIRATAELTLAFMLALLRHLPRAITHARGGGWDRDLFRGRDLFGRTVGVVGHGRLGRIVCRYLTALGCRVLTTDPAVGAGEVEAGATWVSLGGLLREAEIVTLHVNLCRDTEGLVDASSLRTMRPGVILVNTSRGEILDEAALLDGLTCGHIGGAALDVLVGERSAGMAHHPLVQYSQRHDNLILTPHIGGNTVDSLTRVECWLATRLAESSGSAAN